MNSINFNQAGGFPLETNTLEFLEAAHAPLISGIGAMAGNLAVISGCVENGTQVSDGFVQINGETLAFRGGTKIPTVVIVETKEPAVFENGDSKDVYTTRYAAFGAGGQNFNWADFKRIPPLHTLSEKAQNADLDSLAQAVGDIAETLAAAQQNLSSHLNETDNPHGVTAEQVGFFRLSQIPIGDVTSDAPTGAVVKNNNYYSVTREATHYDGQSDQLYRIDFKTPLRDKINTSAYGVFPVVVGKNADWNKDNDVIISVRQKTAAGFRFALREVSEDVQNIEVEFLLMKGTSF